MHLPVEVVGEAAVVVEAREVGAADVADLELLVARGPAGIAEVLELALALGLGLGGLAHAEEVLVGAGDVAEAGEHAHLEEAAVDGGRELGHGLEQHVGLADLVGRLLEAPLRRLDPPVALVDVLLQVPQVVVLEAVLVPRGLGEGLVLGLEGLGVHLRTGPHVLLGVGEQVVRTRADEERAADLGVGEGELGRAGRLRAAHELL